MRKFIAISFIIIFSFNIIGYRLWVSFLENKSESRLEAILDLDQYNENDLIRISLPLNNAYQNDWSEFKRVNGEISFDGKIYHYVKEKVQFGQLILLCLPDHDKMLLEAGVNSKHAAPKIILSALQDECIQTYSLIFHNYFDNYVTPTLSNFNFFINSSFHLSIERPPDVLSC
ncbi:MAG: hypothetical protein NVSMB45_17350 [Ginsengibacter sp.]